MNYTVKYRVGQSDKLLVVATKVDGKIYNIKEILGSASLTNNIYLDNAIDEGVDFPFLVCDNDSRTMNDITALYNIAAKHNMDVPQEHLEKICMALAKILSKEEVLQLIECFKTFRSYVEGERVVIKMSPSWYQNFKTTKELVDSINNSGKAQSLVIDGENKTLFMNKADDELFIRVPDYNEIVMEGALIPSPAEIMSPYPTEELADINYKRYLPSGYPIEFVAGNPANNTLDLQENEARYAKALRSLMESGISKEFPEKEVSECIESNLGSLEVKKYITNLALVGAWINWRHSGAVPLNMIYALCDSDEDDIDSEEEGQDDQNASAGTREFDQSVIGNIKNFKDGEGLISSIIDSLYTADIMSIIDFTIKLFRFGERKPTRIKINETEYLDLNTFMIVRGSGNYTSTEIVSDEDGNNLTVVGGIYVNDYMSDRDYISKNKVKYPEMSMPIGILCRRTYKDTSEYTLVALSFIDLIKAYENNEQLCKVQGITMSNGHLILNPEVEDRIKLTKKNLKEVVHLIDSTSDSSIQYYQYGGFIDSYMEFECFNKKISILSLFNQYYGERDLSILDTYSYLDTDELKDNVVTFGVTPTTCIGANITKYILPIVNYVNEKVQDDIISGKTNTPGKVLYYFSEAMRVQGFIGTTTENARASTTSTTMSVSNSFTKQPEVKETTVKTTVVSTGKTSDTILEDNLDGYTIIRVCADKNIFFKLKEKFPKIQSIDTVAKGDRTLIVVGYMGQKSKEDPMILIDPNKAVTNPRALVDVTSLSAVLSNNMKKLSRDEKPMYKFENSETCYYYCNIINNLFKVFMEGCK